MLGAVEIAAAAFPRLGKTPFGPALALVPRPVMGRAEPLWVLFVAPSFCRSFPARRGCTVQRCRRWHQFKVVFNDVRQGGGRVLHGSMSPVNRSPLSGLATAVKYRARVPPGSPKEAKLFSFRLCCAMWASVFPSDCLFRASSDA
jgi:hypothetical protein